MINNDSLVPWKKKRDMFNEENPDDELKVYGPRESNSLNGVKFVMRDEFNAKSMKAMRLKWW